MADGRRTAVDTANRGLIEDGLIDALVITGAGGTEDATSDLHYSR